MSAVTPQEIVEYSRLTLCGHPYGLELADRIEKHGIAPPDGWVLVPKEPTDEMLDAASMVTLRGALISAWKRMLAAAPEVKP